MIQLLITADDQGQVKVEGAIDNRVVAYGLLESAKDAIRTFHKQAAAGTLPRVLAANGTDLKKLQPPQG
jgi:hypothetical protein